jgi:hypothetical protein
MTVCRLPVRIDAAAAVQSTAPRASVVVAPSIQLAKVLSPIRRRKKGRDALARI